MPQEPDGLRDDAIDVVKTTVLNTFENDARGDLYNWHGGRGWLGIPQTGDELPMTAAAILAVAILAAGAIAFARRRTGEK